MDDDDTDDDDALWSDITKDIKPIADRMKNAGARRPPPVKARSRQKKPDNIVYLKPVTPEGVRRPADASSTIADGSEAPLNQGIDKRTDERLRRGQMTIDARLDLHGLRQSEARTALISFIETAYAQGKRCLLVITGKGARKKQDLGNPEYHGQEYSHESRPGILRENLPRWLREPRLKSLILQSHPAQGRHGGAGAFYILLRRQRP